MRRDITLDELRNIQLDILDKIDEYCRKNNLRYSLGGGTLLGAVRHKGYIPWDDDIDIMLPRPDYDKFIREFGSLYEHLKVQNYLNDEACYIPFSKVFDNRTTLIEPGMINGIYVDVFPIEGLPKEEDIDAYLAKQDKLLNIVTKTTRYYRFKKGKLWLYIKYLLKRLVYPPRESAIKELENLYHSSDFDISELSGAITGRYKRKEIMTSDVFKSYIDLPFEGRTYSAITDFDSYLTKHYGDYMKLPPKDQQVSNHNFIAYWN